MLLTKAARRKLRKIADSKTGCQIVRDVKISKAELSQAIIKEAARIAALTSRRRVGVEEVEEAFLSLTACFWAMSPSRFRTYLEEP